VGEDDNISPDGNVVYRFVGDVVRAIEADDSRSESPHGKCSRLEGSHLRTSAVVESLGEGEGEQILDGVEDGQRRDEELPVGKEACVLGEQFCEPGEHVGGEGNVER